MSVRQAFLALLETQPMHGYQLRQEFETRTGGTWPLNIGQAYTTLQRLARDGLVEAVPPEHDDDPERFRLTPAGHDAVTTWWATPVDRGAPARDELAIKLALAVTVPGVDVARLVQAQRTATMRAMHDYTRLKRTGRPADDAQGASSAEADLAWSLVLDSLVFQAEAELRWLDHVETRVVLAQRGAPAPPATTAMEPAAPVAPAAETHPARRTRKAAR